MIGEEGGDAAPPPPPVRRRVLVVEDEALLALTMAIDLQDSDHEVVGPAFDIGEARRLATTADADAALVNLNLHGVPAYEIARILVRRGIPFAFVTGYPRPVSADLGACAVVGKPFLSAELRSVVSVMLRRADDGAVATATAGPRTLPPVTGPASLPTAM